MNCRYLMAVISWLCAVLVLVVSLATPGLTQLTDKTGDSARYAEREAYISKLRQRQDDSSVVITGRLILEGRLVEPPYNIAITDSSVTVNGLDVYRENSNQRPEKSGDTEDSKAHPYTKIKDVLSNYKKERETHGVDSARKNVLESLLQLEIIDTAYFLTERIIRFLKSGDKYEEELWLREKPYALPKDPAENTQEKLQVYANRLTISLRTGALLIREDGRGPSISYPESETALRQLHEAAATIADFEERKRKITEIIGKERFAEKIAREFK